MKQKQKKEPIKKKMVFRTHIILTIEGRLMDFLIAGCGLVFLYYLFKDSFNKGFNWVFCVGVVFIEAFLAVEGCQTCVVTVLHATGINHDGIRTGRSPCAPSDGVASIVY